MKKNKIISIVLIMIFFSLVLSGCVEKKEGIKLESRDCLVYNIKNIPKELSMLQSMDIQEQDLLFAIFQGLVREDKNGNIIPAIAEDWTLSDNRLQYKFKIRQDARWSNGEKIEAEDFVKMFKWLLKDGKDNEYIKELKCIYGVKEYMEEKRSFKDVAIVAQNKSILQINLNYPCSYFLNILSHPLLTLREKNIFTDNYLSNYFKVNYTGPFKINNVGNHNEITLKKNDYYWEKDMVKCKNLCLTNIAGEDALIQFENNPSNIDVIVNPPKNEVNRLCDTGYVDIYPSFKTLNLIFNVKNNNISKNIHFRKAIKYSLSRNIIDDILNHRNVVMANSVIPSITTNERGGDLGIRDYFSFSPNITDANNYLEKIKIKNYKKNNIILVCKNNGVEKLIANKIKKELKEAIDLNIDIKEYEEQELNKVLQNGKYNIALVENIGTFDNSICFLNQWKNGKEAMFTGYKNADLNYYIDKARNSKNIDKKFQFIGKGEQVLFDDVVLIPILNFNTVLCKKKNIKGLYVTKRGNIIFNYCYKENEN